MRSPAQPAACGQRNGVDEKKQGVLALPWDMTRIATHAHHTRRESRDRARALTPQRRAREQPEQNAFALQITRARAAAPALTRLAFSMDNYKQNVGS
jgi:hypothetical protein